MIAISQPAKLRLVAAAYAGVVALSAAMVFMRYVQYKLHPDDAAQYGGMWAGGDLVLGFFITGLLLVPTFSLIPVLRRDEPGYTTYSKALLCVALSSPLSIALSVINIGPWWLGDVTISRVVAMPLAMILYLVSWVATSFRGARRRIAYAALIEIGTFVTAIAFLMKGR